MLLLTDLGQTSGKSLKVAYHQCARLDHPCWDSLPYLAVGVTRRSVRILSNSGYFDLNATFVARETQNYFKRRLANENQANENRKPLLLNRATLKCDLPIGDA